MSSKAFSRVCAFLFCGLLFIQAALASGLPAEDKAQTPRVQQLLLERKWQFAQAQQLAEAQLLLPAVQSSDEERTWWSTHLASSEMALGDTATALKTATAACEKPSSAKAYMSCLDQALGIYLELNLFEQGEQLIEGAARALDQAKATHDPQAERLEIYLYAARAYGHLAAGRSEEVLSSLEIFEKLTSHYLQGAHAGEVDQEFAEAIFGSRERYAETLERFGRFDQASAVREANGIFAKKRNDYWMRCQAQMGWAGRFESMGYLERAKGLWKDSSVCSPQDDMDLQALYTASILKVRSALVEGRTEDAYASLLRASSALSGPHAIVRTGYLNLQGAIEQSELLATRTPDRSERAYQECLEGKMGMNAILFTEQSGCAISLSQILTGWGHADEAEKVLRAMQARLPTGSMEWGFVTSYLSEVLLRERRMAEAEATAKAVIDRLGAKFGKAAWPVGKATEALAACNFNRREFAEASGYLDAEISAVREVYGADSLNLLELLGTRSDLNLERRNGAESAKDMEEATRIQSLQAGENTVSYLTALGKLRRAYASMNDQAKVEATLLRMVQVVSKESNHDAAMRVQVPLELAIFYQAMNRSKDADRYFILAKKVADRELPADSFSSLKLNYEMGRAAAQKGEYQEAETLLKSMVEVAHSSNKVEWRWLVTGMVQLAIAEQLLGKVDEQEKVLKQAWSIASSQRDSKVNDPVARSVVVALLELYGNQNRVEEARQLRKEAKFDDLEQTEKDPQALLNNVEAILAYYQSNRDLENSQKWAAIASEKAAVVYGESSPMLLRYLQVYLRQQNLSGDTQGALLTTRKLLALVSAQAGEHSPEAVYWHLNLAGWLVMTDKMAEADQEYQAILPWLPAAEKQWPGDIGQALYSYGWALNEKDHYRESQPLMLRAMNALARVWGYGNGYTLQAASVLAFDYRMDKRHKDASELLELIRKNTSPDNARVKDFLTAEQELDDSNKGDWKSSLERSRRSQDLMDRFARRRLAQGSEDRKFDVIKNTELSTAFMVSLYLDKGHSPEEAYQVVLRRKGLAQEAQRLQFAQNGETVQMQHKLQGLAQEISRIEHTHGTDPAALAEKQREYRELDNNVAEASYGPFVRAELPKPKQVLEQLSANTALIELFEYEPIGSRARHYGLFYLRPGKPVAGFDLGPTEEIDRLGAHLRDALAHSGNAGQVNRWGRKLYDKLFSQISFEGVTHLQIAPDGQLNSIPFEVLRPTEDSYFIQRTSISYVGTGRDLLHLGSREPSRQPAVAFIAPDFNASGPGPEPAGLRAMEATVAAAAQVKESVALCPGSFAALAGAQLEGKIVSEAFNGTEVYNGAEATVERLKQVKGPRILHLSTHGFVCSTAGEKSDAGEGGSANRTAAQMYKSGVAMAGANHGGVGILTAAEVALMDLHGTQLAVLSACQTGLGSYESGEGVMGLRRAFFIAGARAQLFSLWDVSDADTAHMMGEYYAALGKGEGHAEALRKEKLRRIEAGVDPYFWAPFVAYGDPGPLGK